MPTPSNRSAEIARRTLLIAAAAVLLAPAASKGEPNGGADESWSFVSIPDFLNNDIPYADPEWRGGLNYVLDAIAAEDPDFVLVAGDLVQGRWWAGPAQVEHLADTYYEDWLRRFRDRELKVYAAVGDHELGDNPWPPERAKLVPHFERMFRRHVPTPDNGPEHMKGLAYYVRHKGTLVVTVDTFEFDGEKMHVTVSGKQLEWLKRVLRDHRDADHIIVQGHVPVLPGVKGRMSSRIMLEGDGQDTPFWQTMAAHGVDLYLAGEHHAVSRQHAGGVEQIVHGSIFGYVDDVNYMVGRVTPETIRLQIKRIPIRNAGGRMWQAGGVNSPHDEMRITEKHRERGFETIGTMVLDKTGDRKQFRDRTGVFAKGD